MKAIDKQLKEVVKTGPTHITDIIKPMQEKYDKYWNKMEDFAAMNVVFDPRCKLAIIEFMLLKEIGTKEVATSLARIKDNIYTLFSEFSQTITPATEPNKPSHGKGKAVGATDNDFNSFLASMNPNQNLSTTGELDLYLQEPPAGITSGKFDILQWWKDHQLRFPTLSMLAKLILMTPATSIASESAFSTSGRVLGDYRSRMKPETLEALVLGQDWIKIEAGLNEKEEDEEDEFNDDIVEVE
jgi:hypothetical protein